jgi:hypothetical protein
MACVGKWQGISLPALQQLPGHDRLTTTEIYLNLSPEDVPREFREKRSTLMCGGFTFQPTEEFDERFQIVNCLDGLMSRYSIAAANDAGGHFPKPQPSCPHALGLDSVLG